MTSRDFVYWLQGLFELGEPKALDEKQTEAIKRHLALVFVHEIDPAAGGAQVQKVLDALHEGKPPRPPGGPAFSPGADHTLYRC